MMSRSSVHEGAEREEDGEGTRDDEEERYLILRPDRRDRLRLFEAIRQVLGDGVVPIHLLALECCRGREAEEVPTCTSGSVSKRGVKSRSGRFASTS